MKFCTKCNVNVNHQLKNCPLCGSYLDETHDNDNCQVYANIDNAHTRPVINFNTKPNFLETKFNRLMLLCMALCFVLNIVFTPTLNWSTYVVVGGMIVMFCIIMPIADKMKLQRQIKVNLFILTIAAVALELSVTRLHFEWFVVTHVLVWVYVAAIVLIDVLIIFRRYEDKGLFSTLALTTIFAIAPQIVMWIAAGVGVDVIVPQWLLIVFFAAILNVATVFIVCTRSLMEEVERTYST
jgi:hypothetical protein